jgi:hypothetical protein
MEDTEFIAMKSQSAAALERLTNEEAAQRAIADAANELARGRRLMLGKVQLRVSELNYLLAEEKYLPAELDIRHELLVLRDKLIETSKICWPTMRLPVKE